MTPCTPGIDAEEGGQQPQRRQHVRAHDVPPRVERALSMVPPLCSPIPFWSPWRAPSGSGQLQAFAGRARAAQIGTRGCGVTAPTCHRARMPTFEVPPPLTPPRCLAALFCVPLAAAAEGRFALATWRAAAPTAAAGWRLTSQIVLTGLYFYGYSEVANPSLNPHPHPHPHPYPSPLTPNP